MLYLAITGSKSRWFSKGLCHVPLSKPNADKKYFWWCWETVFHEFPAFLHVLDTGTDSLCSGISFQGSSLANSLGKEKSCSLQKKEPVWLLSSIRKTMSLSGVKAGRLTHYKRFGSLSSRFLFSYSIWCTGRCYPVFFTVSHMTWGNWYKNDDTLAIAIAMSNKLSFVSDPAVSGLLQASLKPAR